jgi:hypothetical protein
MEHCAMRRPFALAALLAVPALLAGCNFRTVDLEANQQVGWINGAKRDLAVRNTGDTILLLVQEDSARNPVGIYNLQPRERRPQLYAHKAEI